MLNRAQSRVHNSLFDDDEDVGEFSRFPIRSSTVTTTTTSTTRKPFVFDRSSYTYTVSRSNTSYTPYYKRWQTWLIVKLSLIMLFVGCRICLCCCEAAADDTVVLMANRNDNDSNNRSGDAVITISNDVDKSPPKYEAPPPYSGLERKNDVNQKY